MSDKTTVQAAIQATNEAVGEVVAQTEAKVAKTAEEREAEFLAQRDLEITKRYSRVTPGSIRRETDGHHKGKLTVEITCKNKKRNPETGEVTECGNKRRVATSDLFQVKFCEDCIAEMRLAKRRRKAKTARAEKRKATEGATSTATPAKAKGGKGKLKGAKRKMRPIEEVAAEAAAKRANVPTEGEVDAAVLGTPELAASAS